MTTDPSNGRPPHVCVAAAATKALSSLLKNADMPKCKERDERLDNAIRSQSQWMQQQNTRPRRPVQLISYRVEVLRKLTHVESQRIRIGGGPRVHPSDQRKMAVMAAEFADGGTAGVLRMPGHGGRWVPVHVTVNRVELEENAFAGLVSLRLPTDAELADAGLFDLASRDK